MKIYTDAPEGSTVVQNSFIDQYMPHANGEFVKVYLYLLRCADSGRELSLSSIADVFEHTEKDVRRALTYWERQGLLRIRTSPDGELESVTFMEPGCYSTPVASAGETDLYSDGVASYQRETPQGISDRLSGEHTSQANPSRGSSSGMEGQEAAGLEMAAGSGDAEPDVSADGEPDKDVPLPGELPAEAQADLRELFFVAEQYFGRPLSATEQSDFVYYYHTLGFSADLIEYLIEYCVMKDTTSRHYMRKVAQGWAGKRITTVQEAKKETGRYNKNYYTILKAFGIKNRAPAPSEQETMARWIHEYGFSMDLILEACRRTIDQIHEPNFQYADKILTQWLGAGVQTMEDVREADRKWEQEQASKKNSQGRARTGAPNRFNNFTQRSYNYDKLEKRLLGQS